MKSAQNTSLMLFLLSVLFCVAHPSLEQNIEGQIVAAQYGVYQVTGTQDETSTTSFTFPLGTCQVSGGGKNFSGFAAGVPLKVVDANPALVEVATPSAVNIDTCTVTVSTAHNHQLPYSLTSGTGGLQEAINANGTGQGANTIILNADWYELIPPTSAATVIGEVQGNASLGLTDVTTTPYTYYQWNGSAYVAVSNGGPSSILSLLPGTPNAVYTFNAPSDQGVSTVVTDISGNGNNAKFGTTAPAWTGNGLNFANSTTSSVTPPAALNPDETFCASVLIPVYYNSSTTPGNTSRNEIISNSAGYNSGATWSSADGGLQNIQQTRYGQGTEGEAGFHTLCLVMGLSGNATYDTYYTDGVANTTGAFAQSGGTQTTGTYVFGWNGNYYSYMTMYGFAAWPTQLTSAQVLQASNALTQNAASHGVQTVPASELGAGPSVVAAGDSITYGYESTTPWPTLLSVGTHGQTVVDNGIYGITANAIGQMSRWRDAPYCSTEYGKSVAVLFAGTNDVAAGFTTLTQIISYITSYATQLEKAGCQVGVATMISRSGHDTGTVSKDTLNPLVRSNAAAVGYFVVDMASEPNLGADGAYSNTTYFNSDGTHPTNAGQALLAAAASNAINANWIGAASAANPTQYTNTASMLSVDRFVTATPTAATTYTLPDCLGVTGTVYQIFNAAAGSDTITFTGLSNEAITGSTTLAQNATARFQATLISQAAAGCGWQRIQ